MKVEIKLVYETPEFLVLNKPAGILVHGTTHKEKNTVVDWVLRHYPEVRKVGDKPEERAGIVHRLDKETSGVLIIARTQNSFLALKSLFQESGVKKIYKTLVWGELRGSGVINTPIGLKPGSVKRSVLAKNMKMVKPARTEYQSLEVYEKNKEIFSYLNVFPKTGRTHQIRVHLHSIHHPVVGDALYGKRKDPWDLGRHFLHAESLEFSWGQGGEKIRVEADLTPELTRVLEDLRKKTIGVD